MKKFIKGVRFAPKNYSDEVEVKIQHYKRKVINYRRATYCAPKNNWRVSAKVPKSTPHCWITFLQTSAKECPLRKLTTWFMNLQRIICNTCPFHVRRFSQKCMYKHQ